MRALEAACDVDRHLGEAAMSHDELAARVRGKEALISVLTDQVDRAVLEAGTGLRIIANIAVGFNNIDLAAARERGIVVTNTPDVLTGASADFTWALILGITRRLGEGERLLRRGEWKGWALDFMLGTELRGKQLGIVGFGRLGRAVAQRALAFGMRVVYSSRTPREDAGAQAMPLDRLLATSDVVSLHVPLTPETRHLIDQPALARMKRSAYLINTARGPVVDEEALRHALLSKQIAAAGLDVMVEEPPLINHPLFGLENVTFTPHSAGPTWENWPKAFRNAFDNVQRVARGEKPLWVIPEMR